jgi:uncharacterized membrane protein YraQ (UPF0718 family)
MSTSFVFYTLALSLLMLSYLKDKTKTKMALKKAYKSFMKLIPALIPMILFVGIILTAVSPEIISKVIGEESGLVGVITSLIFGSIIFMPSFVSFSLGANLLQAGAGYAQVGALIAALMAVGISSLSVELKYFDKKLTVFRNGMALIASIVFAVIIGMVM